LEAITELQSLWTATISVVAISSEFDMKTFVQKLIRCVEVYEKKYSLHDFTHNENPRDTSSVLVDKVLPKVFSNIVSRIEYNTNLTAHYCANLSPFKDLIELQKAYVFGMRFGRFDASSSADFANAEVVVSGASHPVRVFELIAQLWSARDIMLAKIHEFKKVHHVILL
jgi:hypothetical protein